MHETFERRQDIRGPSERTFGATLGGIAAVVALAPLVVGDASRIRWWLLAVAAVLAALAALRPALLRPLNDAWRKTSLLLARIVNPVVLAILYFGLLTPLAFVMRRVAKDRLQRARRADANSYWIPREPPGPPPNSMEQQF